MPAADTQASEDEQNGVALAGQATGATWLNNKKDEKYYSVCRNNYRYLSIFD